jgi:hypothetical protein
MGPSNRIPKVNRDLTLKDRARAISLIRLTALRQLSGPICVGVFHSLNICGVAILWLYIDLLSPSTAIMRPFTSLAVAASLIKAAEGQTYQRLGACPSLGCVMPPDQ